MKKMVERVIILVIAVGEMIVALFAAIIINVGDMSRGFTIGTFFTTPGGILGIGLGLILLGILVLFAMKKSPPRD